MLNLKNTLDGYLKNVEVIGNTVQDTNNLANIRSVGDKVEGQELYKIDVVSCGKNLFKMCKDNEIHRNSYNGIIEIQHNGFSLTDTRNGDMAGFVMKCKPNTEYVVTFNDVSSTKVQKFFRAYTEYPVDSNANYNINVGTTNGSSIKLTTTSNCNYIFFGVYGSNGTSTIKDIQIEEGTVATPYEPYQENKLEILSPVQLEKVEDVADRIICKDGVWGIEKHIGHYTFIGNEITLSQGVVGSTNRLYWAKCNPVLKNKPSTRYLLCNVQKYGICGTPNKEGLHHICFNNDGTNMLFDTDKDISGANNYLRGNYIKYILAEPQFIPLPQDQQVKLRTFAGQTNIAFLTEIAGQIKAQVPKSLGATVNTHTEQIKELHNSLERVKKLEETTVSTVETESNFNTVDATNNGYFEGVKLEGKTMVNLSTVKSTSFEFKSSSPSNGQDIPLVKNINGVFTLIVDMKTNTLDRGVKVSLKTTNNSYIYPASISQGSLGKVILCYNTLKDGVMHDITHVRLYTDNSTSGRVDIDNITILEGDHTNNPPEYFEGLMSVGQDVEEVSVESMDENLFDGIFTSGYRLTSAGAPIADAKYNLTNYLPCNSNTSYFINLGWEEYSYICFYDENKTFIERFENINKCISPTNAKYFRYTSDLSFNTLSIATKQDKKRILYYNPTTETWEKPILREWDTIEKHSDGKYYYHKRSGEIVLNGSESWNVGAEQATTIRYQLSLNTIKPQSNLICDKFAQILGGTDSEGISNHFSSNMLQLTLNKDKGSVKQWLQANPTTVVYQLAQEEVYECTNIDLMTYSGETNYIINSGAISPKSLLKVHNNISNVVKILQEKVSLLENTFIAGLKSVLSGDMYSLATILYPEDFEQNDNIEQDIMVIPE